MQAGHGQQRRNGRVVLVHAAIGEDEDVDLVFLDHAPGFGAHFLDGRDQAVLAPVGAEQDGQRAHLEAGQRDAPHLGEFLVGQHRPGQLQAAAVRGPRVEQVALTTQPHIRRGDDLFADAVDGRVRHLGEQLLEVVVQHARFLRQRRQRRVVAHGADAFVTVPRHRRHEDALILEGVAEGHLALRQCHRFRRRQFRRRGQILEMHQVLLEPLGVRALVDDLLLDLFVFDDAAQLGVHEEHAARLQAALAHDVLGRELEHAGLGGHDADVVLGHVVAARAQAVAVEHRADALAVGEADVRGAVPRLHQTTVVLVESLERRVHGRVLGPGLGDHHHDRVRHGAAREHHELEHVVEHGGVRPVRIHDGWNLLDVLAEQRRVEQRLARAHPVDVAAKRIDLAVVSDAAVRVRAVPAREGVGAETRVHQRDGRFHQRVLQVEEIRVQLVGGQHALVDQGLVRQRHHVPVLGAADGRHADLVVRALADHVELALELGLVDRLRSAADEHLAREGLGGLGGLAQHGVVHGHGARAQVHLAFGLHHAREHFFDLATLRGVARHEDVAGGVHARFGQVDARIFLGHLLQEGVRHLDQHAGAVPGVHLGAAGAAVIQILQDLDALFDDGVRFAALDVHDEADATGVMLELGVIEALLCGRAQSDRGHFPSSRRKHAGRHHPASWAHAHNLSLFNWLYPEARPRNGAAQAEIYMETDHTDA
ncbi:MAG: hypothetical protein K0Q92_3650 [Steroidobacteraceae bacterium]|nr:hypothetical protein [Steroidobacteraceae bacterium]